MRRLMDNVRRAMTGLLRDTRATVAIITVMTIPIIAGFMALGVDATYWYMVRVQLQTAADAASLAGTYEVINLNNDAGVLSAAQKEAVRNGFDSSKGVITVNRPPTSGPEVGNDRSVEVIISQPISSFFSTLFVNSPITVQARAVAISEVLGESAVCYMTLHPTAPRSLWFSQQTVGEVNNCAVKVNSSSSTGFTLDNSQLQVYGQVSVGGRSPGIAENGTTQTQYDRPPSMGDPPVNDPLAGLDVPPLPACEPGTAFGTVTVISASTTLGPGRYCGGLTLTDDAVTGPSTVNLDPGIYFIDGGDLVIENKTQLYADEVVFILTGNTPADVGTLAISGQAQIQATAPTSGDFAGILFYQDRKASSGRKNVLKGQSILQTDGSLYFPSQELVLKEKFQLQTDPMACVSLIADTMDLDDVQVQITCLATSPNAVIIPIISRHPKLVE